jgi:hypothetical protein
MKNCDDIKMHGAPIIRKTDTLYEQLLSFLMAVLDLPP